MGFKQVFTFYPNPKLERNSIKSVQITLLLLYKTKYFIDMFFYNENINQKTV